MDVLNADQVRTIVNEKGSSSDITKLNSANTDWQDEIYETAFGQDLNLNASGAIINGKLPFRLSGGFLNQDGILKGRKF